MEQTNTGAAMPAKRPQFLTVLCILTYVGVGISIIVQILGFLAMQAAGAMMGGMESLGEGMGSSPEMDAAMASANALMSNAYLLLAVGIIGAILCLVGAIMMWKQKKTGFYIYVVGEMVPPILSLVLVGMAGMGSMGIFGLVLPIAFTVMYGLNLKHMS
jgi:hypothetical protein